MSCAALLLGGCGQKGPLYLPGDPSEIQTEIPPQPGEADADSPEDADDDADDVDP